MESQDGPLLQRLFDDLDDFRTPFGEPGSADAVSTFLALPDGSDYESKLLLGIWRNDQLVGVLDCIMGYSTTTTWTIGLLLVADRHRRHGLATSVVAWLETTATGHGTAMMRAVLRDVNADGIAFARACGYRPAQEQGRHPGLVVLARVLAD